MRNLKLILQYDGSRFHGFQIQPTARTVQGELENMLTRITGVPTQVQGCSRTDAGVHAYRYCCNFHTDFPIPAERLPIVMNNSYIDDIKIISCTEAENDFNARFDTKYKTYRYLINTSKDPDVFARNYEWQYSKHELDVDLMKQGAAYIVGKHDFCSFMTSGAQVLSTVREVFSLSVEKKNDLIEILISADGYLYNMVRIIVGTLVCVGEGKYPPSHVAEIIEACNRQYAGPTAPPQGLYLYEIVY